MRRNGAQHTVSPLNPEAAKKSVSGGEPRYNTFNAHLRRKFGCRVTRVAIDTDATCPNRDGTKSRGGCLFCSGGGSLAPYADPGLPIAEQVRRGIEFLSRRTGKEQKFLPYLQGFTSTYRQAARLRDICSQALGADDRIVGLAVGGRPDCLDDSVLDLLAEIDRRTYLWLDVGLETTNDRTLERVNRHTSTAEFDDAMRRAKSRRLRVCAHIIFGLPGDSDNDMMGCIDLVNRLRLDGIKIHNLYIDADSPYGQMWKDGQVQLMQRDRYIDLVCKALARLRPEILVHRLTGEAPRDRHLAPDWARNKSELLGAIRAELLRRDLHQGSQCQFGPP